MRKKFVTGAFSLALGFVTVFSGILPAAVPAASVLAAETATQAETSYKKPLASRVLSCIYYIFSF